MPFTSRLLLVLVASALISGCTAVVDEKRAMCREMYSEFKTVVSCTEDNVKSSSTYEDSADADLADIYFEYGYALARKVDAGSMTKAQAWRKWEKFGKELNEKEEARQAARFGRAMIQGLSTASQSERQSQDPTSVTTGNNKICYYTCPFGTAATTVGATDICPASINEQGAICTLR